MRAIIPAAGLGTRLRPVTGELPKGLVPIGDRPLLWHTLERLMFVGVTEVVVVCGYRAERLRRGLEECPVRPRLVFVTNEEYATSNSIVSLSLTRDWWWEPFCVIDGDVLLRRALLGRLVAARGDRLVIDATKRHESIDMKVEIRAGWIRRLSKDLEPERCSGEFFGVARWSPQGAARLASALDRLLARGRRDLWYESAIEEVAQGYDIAPLYVAEGDWAEVDSSTDLAAAEHLVDRDREERVAP